MRSLFIMDPLEKLSPQYDSTLYLFKEFYRRGHKSWVADVPDIFATEKQVFAHARTIHLGDFSKKSNPHTEGRRYAYGKSAIRSLESFDLILIRKEPPFDLSYLYLTYLLERLAGKVALSNDPRGIRNYNEKLASFRFPKWNARSVVTSRIEPILDFQKAVKKDLVIKPLNNRAGLGVVRLRFPGRSAKKILNQATQGEKQIVIAQEFLGEPPYRDKRITLLDGNILFVFEKKAAQGEFRANLCRGGRTQPASLTQEEKKLVETLKPYLRKEGLHLVGLDVLQGKLIDFNVTCPSGLWDAKDLYPKLGAVESWADFLERLAGV